MFNGVAFNRTRGKFWSGISFFGIKILLIVVNVWYDSNVVGVETTSSATFLLPETTITDDVSTNVKIVNVVTSIEVDIIVVACSVVIIKVVIDVRPLVA